MKKRIFGLLTVLCLLFGLMPGTVFAADAVVIDAVNFPDETFRNYISKVHDKNDDGYLSSYEVGSVRSVEADSLGISDLTGVEHFTKLEYLYCSSNQLKKLDL